MKKTLILTTLIMICSLVFGWDLIRQTAFPANFYTLDIVGTHIWAGGSGGAVTKSTDNGVTWSFVPSPFFNADTATYRTIEDIDFYDENHGVVVGGMGIVAITSDGGSNWTYPASVQALIGTTELKSCVYHSSGKIWICGSSGIIAYSPDHGASWSLQNAAGLTTILYGMSMNEAGIGFIACNKGSENQPKILKTNDFGTTWTIQNLTIGGTPSIFNVRQFGSKVVLVGDFGYLGYSDDNGENWTNHSYAAGSTTSDELHDVVMIGDVGYAVGWNYRIIKTTDGWATFSPVSHNFSASYMEGIVQNTAGNLVACGWQGTLSISTDGAITWEDSVPNAVDLWKVSMLDANTWFIAGDKGNILKTNDGGQTLIKKKIPGFDDILYACHFFDTNTGIVSGKTVGKIYRTTDGGDTWSFYTVPGFASAKSYYDFFFFDNLTGYALGVGGKVAKTVDGGVTWALTGDNINTTHNLYCTYWKDQQTGYAGSGSGLLYMTTNGGTTWTSITVGASSNVRGIWFRDANNGVLVKENGEIWYTLTGGNTAGAWIAATESAVSQVTSVMCDHNGVFWAAGYSNGASQAGTDWMLLKSLDFGATWTSETLPALTFNPGRLLNISTEGGKIVAIGRNNIIYAQLEIPEHVTLNSPANNDVDLDPANVLLGWTPSQYGSVAAFYQVFVSDSEDAIFDQHYFETPNTSFDLSAAFAANDLNLGYSTRWFWAVLPVNEILDSPDINSDNFMIWRFTTMAEPVGTLETPIVSIEKLGTQVRISWLAVPNALSYKILGCPTPYGTYSELTVTGATDHVVLNPGPMEFYKVIASSVEPQ